MPVHRRRLGVCKSEDREAISPGFNTAGPRPNGGTCCQTGRRYRLEDISAQLQIVARRHWGTAHRPKELMRDASIQTTMDVYGKAMADSKRQANTKVVRMVLKPEVPTETAPDAFAATGS